MVLSALAVVYITTPESAAATEQSLSNTYNVVQSSDGDSNAKLLGTSLINGLVIVSVICVMTFVIVLLYKYRCLSCLIGYMMLSSALLLGFLASQMFMVAIERYQLKIDKLTFYVTMYNFAIGGVVCIFAPAFCVPMYLTQAYLICNSVVVAWELAHFDPWTAWVLLVLLALYDLFAVLTPCGPLKYLVDLMSQDDSPSMPGLLYEASLPLSSAAATNATRQQQYRRRRRRNNNNDGGSGGSNNNDTANSNTRRPEEVVPSDAEVPVVDSNRSSLLAASVYDAQAVASTPTTTMTVEPAGSGAAAAAAIREPASVETRATSAAAEYGEAATADMVESSGQEAAPLLDVVAEESGAASTEGLRTGRIPFAIAKMYKLRFLHDPQPPWITAAGGTSVDDYGGDDDAAAAGEQATADAVVSYTPEQLCEQVDVIFPGRGGCIVPTVSLENAAELYRRTQATDETRYTIIDYRGVHKRVLFVNADGRIFEDLREQNAAQEKQERNSIRLGLGDFIFYSILVSKAAQYSYTTFAVCSLAILAGLGITLLLLAMYGKALPALPISIFLGVVFYLFTRYVMEPWVQEIFIQHVYA